MHFVAPADEQFHASAFSSGTIFDFTLGPAPFLPPALLPHG
jgi:hypothetical protein